MAVPGAASPGVTAGGVPYPNLADPATAQTFANQAVAGGGNYVGTPGGANKPPLPPAQADAAAAALQNQPSNADIANGMQFAASLMGSGYNPSNAYSQQFQASLGAQRQAIDNALHTSLQQLAGRRNAAAAVVAAIPGQVKGSFQQAEGKAKTISGAANKKTEAGTGHGSLGGNANEALYQADFRQNEGAGLAATPLLHAGVQANYDLGEAGLQQQHLAGVEAIDQQQAAFDAQMAQQQNAQDFQASQNNLQYRRGLAASAAASAANPPLSFAQQQDLKGIDPRTGVPFSVEAGGAHGGLTAYQATQEQYKMDAGAAKNAGLTIQQYRTVQDSPQYKEFVNRYNAFVRDPQNTADEPVKMAKDLVKAGNTSLLAVLVANGVLSPEDAAKAKG